MRDGVAGKFSYAVDREGWLILKADGQPLCRLSPTSANNLFFFIAKHPREFHLLQASEEVPDVLTVDIRG